MLKKRTLALLLSLTMLLSLLTPTALATEGEESGTAQEEVVKSNENERTDLNGATENGAAKDENQAPQQPTTGDEEQPTGQDEPKNEDETKGEDGQPGEEPKQPEQPTEPEPGEATETPEEPQESEFDAAAVYAQLMACETAEEMDAIAAELTEEQIAQFSDEQLAAIEERYAELKGEEPEEDPVGESVSFTDVGPLLDQDEDQMIPGILKAALLGGIGTYSDDQDNGVRLSKSVKAVDGGYQITLEAYATGSSTTVVSTNPVDIVLVLDVSGSMDDLLSPQKVYSSELDKSKTYYYYSNYSSDYREVTWNANGRTWGYYINYYGWHSVTPKANANDDWNTQFYVGERKISALKFARNKTNTVGNNVYGDYSYNYSQIVKELTKVDGNKAELKSTIDSLTAAGATSADYGMQHAQAIINKAVNDKNNKNKKVVIMFTDGEPNHNNGFSDTVANDAIKASKSIKAAGATVYTIGVFGEANGTPVSNVNTLTKFNKYMHFVSSNYKDATSLTNYGQATYPDGGKSYYLSATNSSDLSNIFTQISQEVGGSTVELDEKSYILDTVTDQFKIPTGTDVVKFYTEDCIGKDPTSGKETFDEKTKVEAPDVTYEIKDNTLKVTNFDFSANWCGPRDGKYSGKKLIVEFTVTERDGFLGGNDVTTNVGEADGVYDKAGNRYGEFDPPTVNVPIEDVTVGAEDKNIYVMGGVTVDELRKGTTIKVGDVELKLGETNYGLADWQTEYVTITVTVKDKDGNVITGFESLADDTPFTVEVTVTPKNLNPTSKEGKMAEETTSKGGEATVHVLKPTVTWTDCQKYYGESLDGFTATPVSVTWADSKDNKTTATAGQDAAPTLSYEFTIVSGETVMPNKDVNVIVMTKINGTDVTNHTTYGWQKAKFCTDKESKPAEAQFRVHPLTCTLTISKSGWETIDENQCFLFTYERTGGNSVNATIKGTVTVQGDRSVRITGLPIGTYQVSEDENWSWRYGLNGRDADPELTTSDPTAEVKFTNKRNNGQWLNGCSWAVNNWNSSTPTKAPATPGSAN